MTDIFFSYTSADRERVRPVLDALIAQGFEVFWDQQVPAGVDWDTWIRQHLAKSKCAVVFWSSASVLSKNVRHEATVAERQGKLIPVLLEPLAAEQFPMGLYAQQAANLVDWAGDFGALEWRKLSREIEAKLMPSWVQRRVEDLEAELAAERARRDSVERRDKTLQAQIAKEVETQQDLKRERNAAVEEAAALRTTVEKLSREHSVTQTRVAELQRRLENASFGGGRVPMRVTDAMHKRRWALQAASFAAALATIGFWTYQMMQPSGPSGGPAPQQTRTGGPFSLRAGLEAFGPSFVGPISAPTVAECEQKCANSAQCAVFTYNKGFRTCYLYSQADLRPNASFDSGVRN